MIRQERWEAFPLAMIGSLSLLEEQWKAIKRFYAEKSHDLNRVSTENSGCYLENRLESRSMVAEIIDSGVRQSKAYFPAFPG